MKNNSIIDNNYTVKLPRNYGSQGKGKTIKLKSIKEEYNVQYSY